MEEDETRPILSQQTVNEADDDIIVKAKTVTETEAPDSSFLSNNGDSQCHTNKTSRAYIERTDAQKMTSDWLMLLALFSSIPGIVTDVVMGSFSDKYGRKNFVVISLVGTFLKTLLTAIGMSTNISVTYFLLFAGIEGVTGGWCFVVSIAYAYVSDLTASNTTRTFAITLVEISVGLGLVLSGVTAGYLIKYVGFVYSMIVISGLNGLNLIVILLFLPESLHKSKMTPPDKQGALFAGTAVMQSVCTVLSEVMLKSTYTATVASFRGFVFLVFGGFSVLTLVTFIIFVIASKLSKTKSISMQQKDIYPG